MVKFLCNFLRHLVVRISGYVSRGLRFDSRHHQIFWEAEGLEWGPLNLVHTTEELPGRNISDTALDIWEKGHGGPLRWPRNIIYPQKLALTSPTSCGRSAGIVRSRNRAKEFVFFNLSHSAQLPDCPLPW
jgi:hypothetical protein